MRYTFRPPYILEDGRAVAIPVPFGGPSDIGVRLTGLLNLADRDERLLDHLGELITHRNEA